jgi:hypothetical protein
VAAVLGTENLRLAWASGAPCRMEITELSGSFLSNAHSQSRPPSSEAILFSTKGSRPTQRPQAFPDPRAARWLHGPAGRQERTARYYNPVRDLGVTIISLSTPVTPGIWATTASTALR